jgi:hypothetical protein
VPALETVTLDELRETIANALAAIKAYNLPAVCSRLGLAHGDAAEAHSSKRVYVRSRLITFGKDDLLRIAQDVLQEVKDADLANLVSEVTVHAEHRITEITRRDVLKGLNPLNILFGDVPLFDGLNLITQQPLVYDGWDDHMNFLPSLAKEINQHYIRNDDWSNEELLITCGALTCSQTRFFAFIEKLLDPVVRRGDEQSRLAATLDEVVKRDGFAVIVADSRSGYPIYAVRKRATGVTGAMKNLIFASIGDKPELLFRDAINNDVEIVRNADKVLIFDRPLPPSGMLLWKDLVAWWQDAQAIEDAEEAKAQLYRRLLQSVRLTQSPGEFAIFRCYYERYGKQLGEKLAALIPQVYLHYDPYTKRERGDEFFLARQRMDFLLMLEHGVRIVVEVDGRRHYADPDPKDPEIFRADATLYANMVAEDRRLRLAGYEVFRFGGADFRDVSVERSTIGPDAKAIVTGFFDRLLKKHGIL